MIRVIYHPDAATDLNQAVADYNKVRSGLGDALRTEIYGAIEKIREGPQRHPEIEAGVRRAFVRRFPYSILFEQLDRESVRVFVIRHHRRHPSFGLKRR